MRILFVGSGGREHAFAWKVNQSRKCSSIFATGANPGIAQLKKFKGNVDISPMALDDLANFAIREQIDLTIVGPEAPLIAGICDVFRENGLSIFGPSKAAAQIEGSKIFSRLLTQKYDIPHADFRVCRSAEEATDYVTKYYRENPGKNVVVKHPGQALGKGALPCSCLNDALRAIDFIMVQKAFGETPDGILIEERLVGQEASIIVLTDGEDIVPIVSVKDRKRIGINGTGDLGPMTGGMGGNAPIIKGLEASYAHAISTLVIPTLTAMQLEGCPFSGFFYTGVMFTDRGPKIIEHNCRGGDPETQISLPLLNTDLLEMILEIKKGRLTRIKPSWKNECSIGVVLASGGYPGPYEKGKVITGLDEAEQIEGIHIFHAGTERRGNDLVTSGGRVLAVIATGEGYETTTEKVYQAVEKIHFEGMYYRDDIGRTI